MLELDDEKLHIILICPTLDSSQDLCGPASGYLNFLLIN